MKKFMILILMMVFIILPAALYAEDAGKATGTADILITLDIEPEAPRFALATTSGVQSNVKDYAETSGGDITTESAAITSELNQKLVDGENAAIGFSILQTQRSRIKASYSLSVASTPLVMVRDSSDNATGITVGNYASAPDSMKFNATVSTIAAGTLTNVTLTSGNPMTAAYDGKFVSATQSTDEKTIGTFTVTYEGNLSAELGDYESLVTLTVTSST